MNFFEEIKGIIGDKTITISITADGERLTVISLPRSKNDEPLVGFVPLCLSGTSDQLDAGFMNSLAKSVEVLKGLQSNLDEVEKSTIESKSKPAPTATKKTRGKKEAATTEENADKEPSNDSGLPFSDSTDTEADSVFDDVNIDPPVQHSTPTPAPTPTASRPAPAAARPATQPAPAPAAQQTMNMPEQPSSQPINEASDEW